VSRIVSCKFLISRFSKICFSDIECQRSPHGNIADFNGSVKFFLCAGQLYIFRRWIGNFPTRAVCGDVCGLENFQSAHTPNVRCCVRKYAESNGLYISIPNLLEGITFTPYIVMKNFIGQIVALHVLYKVYERIFPNRKQSLNRIIGYLKM
jgi:hypothetical protein